MDERCRHEMIVGTCAICLKLKTPEEEQEELDRGLIRLAERLGRSED